MWFTDLIFRHSVANTVIVFSAVIALGMAIGHVKLFKISLGIAGVLFAGLFIGHFRPVISIEIIDFIREFGLILFVYTIGIQIGPAFFASFRKQGMLLNGIAALVVLMGFLTASAILLITGLPVQVVVGIMSGAVTNTPGLGAAQEIIREAFPNNIEAASLPGLGYAMNYPFGIFGIIIVMLICRRLFKIDLQKESEEFRKIQAEITNAPSNFNIIVTNQRLAGQTLRELHKLVDGKFVVSRIYRKEEVSVPSMDTCFELGDILHVVTDRQTVLDIAFMAGDISEIDIRAMGGNLASRQVNVTSRAAVQKTVGELDLPGRFGVNATRISRAGIEFVAHPSVRLQFGDTMTAVGVEADIGKATEFLGNSRKELEHPKILPIFLGIIAGVILGSIPLEIANFAIPVKLGLAGGTLLSAIVLSRIGQIGRISWYLAPSANLVLRELGITLFLACVGLRSGERFVETILNGSGFYWMGLGVFITLVPLLITALACWYIFKMNYLTVCGLLSGSMTDPPALSFACEMSGSDAPAITYATVYALTMFLRIIAAQMLVIFFLS